MEKVSEEVIVKTAHLIGVTHAMLEHGYSQEGIKLAYVQSGLFPAEIADYFVKEAAGIDMTKEAIAPAILAGAAAIGSKVAPWIVRGAKAVKGWIGGAKGKVVQGVKDKVTAAKGAVGQAGQAWNAAEGAGAKAKLLGSGAKNFGAGAVFGRGEGVGGGLGRATMYGGMAAGAAGTGAAMLGRRRNAQQQQPMMQQYPPQGMYGG